MLKKKKGFTLVELLIVIVVIGVLSAMMMLSSTEAVSSAKAANIVNNFHNWKTATLEYYADNIDKVEKFGSGGKTAFTNFADYIQASDIMPYLNGTFKTSGFTRDAKYGGTPVQDSSGLIYFTDHNSSLGKAWLIACEFPNDDRIKEKLASRAKTAGLIAKDGTTYEKTDGRVVFIMVENFNN